jgi:hypothetical protein
MTTTPVSESIAGTSFFMVYGALKGMNNCGEK